MKKQLLISFAIFFGMTLYSCQVTDLLKDKSETLDGLANATTLVTKDYGTFTIQNKADNKYIEVAGFGEEKFKGNAKMVQYAAPFGPATWQKWQVIYRKTENNIKYYRLMSIHSGKSLNIPASQLKAGVSVQQNSFSGSDHMLWELRLVGTSGYYNIINKASGMLLTNLNNSPNNNNPIVQQPATVGFQQEWRFTEIPAEAYRDDIATIFFKRNNKALGSVAFDQGSSIPLTWGPNAGKNLWITQDAYDGFSLNPTNMKLYCNHYIMYSNSILLQPSNDWNPNNTLNIRKEGVNSNKICDAPAGSIWSWPSNGVEIGDKVYFHSGEGGENGNPFKSHQQVMYILTQSAERENWKAERVLIEGMSNKSKAGYVNGMVKELDNYVYVFGSEGISYGFESNIHVARFHVNSPRNWEYFNGSTFVPKVSDNSAPIGKGLGSNAITKVNGKYVLITLQQGFDNCNGERWVYAATSTNPKGPFSVPKKVYKIQDQFLGTNARYYTPNVHPQYNNGRKELLITYSLNYSACPNISDCEADGRDPNYYRLRAVRVPYSLIGM